jgi:hypothetical protein
VLWCRVSKRKPPQLSRLGPRVLGFPSFKHVYNVRHLPKAISDPGRHRGSGPQRLMNAHEIVVQGEQRDRMRVVLDTRS